MVFHLSRRSHGMNHTNEPLREEWDFEHFLYDEDAEFIYRCFAYEYARSVPSIVAAFDGDGSSGAGIRGGTWRRYLVVPKPEQPAVIDCFPYMDFNYFDVGWCEPEDVPDFEFDTVIAPQGFPGKPFLALPVTPDEEGWDYIIPRSKAVASVSRVGDTWFEKSTHHPAPPDEVFSIRVRWEASNDVIIRNFKEWLESRERPRLPTVLRGKGGTQKLLDDLKALGAWRLNLFFGENIAAAQEFCTREKGRRLYVRDGDWKKPIRRAQAIIDDWSRREIFG